jgi:hypothetical protein
VVKYNSQPSAYNFFLSGRVAFTLTATAATRIVAAGINFVDYPYSYIMSWRNE